MASPTPPTGGIDPQPTVNTLGEDVNAINPVSGPEPSQGKEAKVNGSSSPSCTSNPSISAPDATTSPSPASQEDPAIALDLNDPLNFSRHRKSNISRAQLKRDHPNGKPRKLKKFYLRQNDLIDNFLGAHDEERQGLEEHERMRPKIKFAVNASFLVNLCLFIIQLYAAISTGSLALFATAADAFMDLISSFVMLVTSRVAARPSVYNYPVGRTRIETIGIILFCALMTTVAIQLMIESGRSLARGETPQEELQIIPLIFVGTAIGVKTCMMFYCYVYRKFPTVHVFFIDHRNDIIINIFGLVMSIVGDKFVWYLDPVGAILIAIIILISWVSNAFEHIWLLVGKSAPRDFISKVIYMSMTHDSQIHKVDTCRAYHAGERYYVEVDIVMDEDTPLRISHDVSQSLQRKLEGLIDVERAFVHVDYEGDHCIHTEHKSPHPEPKLKEAKTMSFKERMASGQRSLSSLGNIWPGGSRADRAATT